MRWYEYQPYVSVAEKKAKAKKEVARRRAKGQQIQPVEITGKAIATTFWGKSWCKNLESYSDFENRLPRGRSYVLHGSVIHLEIQQGLIYALVKGSETYEVRIQISTVLKKKWQEIKNQSSGQIGSLIELLQGKISKAVMELVTNRDSGLFPSPSEIKMKCNCPDYADMCKHISAVMYGVGNRLDSDPELLFLLRGVDYKELLENAISSPDSIHTADAPRIAADDLGAIFGIEIDLNDVTQESPLKPENKPKKIARSRTSAPNIAKSRTNLTQRKSASTKAGTEPLRKPAKPTAIRAKTKSKVKASEPAITPAKLRQKKQLQKTAGISSAKSATTDVMPMTNSASVDTVSGKSVNRRSSASASQSAPDKVPRIESAKKSSKTTNSASQENRVTAKPKSKSVATSAKPRRTGVLKVVTKTSKRASKQQKP